MALYENKQITVDENGQVLESVSEVVTKTPQTPDFVMAFTRDLGYLQNISGGASKLLFGLIASVDRNNEITLNMARKKRIAVQTGLKLSSLNGLLAQLKKKEVILSTERGIYILNPFLFGKGKWKNVQKMRMTIEYDFEKLTKKIDYENEYGVDEDEINLLDFEDN